MKIDVHGKLALTVKDLTGERVFVSGVSGSGKSNTVGVLIEEFLSHMPVTIIDPAGEYWGLREKFEAIIVGKSDNADFDVDVSQVSKLAEYTYLNSIPLIIDLLGKKLPEQRALLEAYTEAVWSLATTHKRPHQIVLEEAPQFIPQSGKLTPFKDLVTLIALQGRKFGLGLITVAQRPSMVHKDVITQSGLYLFHRQTYETDIRKYVENIPLTKAEVWEQAPRLDNGQAFAVYNHQPQIVQIRQRHTFHAGATPDLAGAATPTLRKVDATLIAELQDLLQQTDELADERSGNGELKRLRKQLKQRDELISKLKAENRKLRQQPTSAAPLLPPTKPDKASRSSRKPQPTPQAIERQRKVFDRLVRQIQQFPKHEREVLRYLMTMPHLALNGDKLSLYLGYSRHRVSKSPPTGLLEMGLLQRQRGRNGYMYSSRIKEAFRDQFPFLDPNQLVTELEASIA